MFLNLFGKASRANNNGRFIDRVSMKCPKNVVGAEHSEFKLLLENEQINPFVILQIGISNKRL